MSGRGYLTDREFRELFEAQGCRCCVPGCESDGPFEGEHSTPNAFSPGKPDQIMCVTHHKAKTRSDKAKIAKAKRINGTTRSRWNGDKPVKKIPSRGFQKNKARTREEIMGLSK